MKYIIITESDKEKFEQAVNAKISEGYEPIGGIAIASPYGAVPSKKYCYTQAMIISFI